MPANPSPAPAHTLRIGGITPLTTIDFPGRLAAVLYCQGCPWRCSYCHNPELLDATAPAAVPWSQVLAFLQSRRGLLDGVVFSGGEPTLQAALPAALAEVRAMGFATGLHTGGMYPERLAAVLPLLDWVGLDVKGPLHAYDGITGVPGSGKRAWESLQLVVLALLAHVEAGNGAVVAHHAGPDLAGLALGVGELNVVNGGLLGDRKMAHGGISWGRKMDTLQNYGAVRRERIQRVGSLECSYFNSC